MSDLPAGLSSSPSQVFLQHESFLVFSHFLKTNSGGVAEGRPRPPLGRILPIVSLLQYFPPLARCSVCLGAIPAVASRTPVTRLGSTTTSHLARLRHRSGSQKVTEDAAGTGGALRRDGADVEGSEEKHFMFKSSAHVVAACVWGGRRKPCLQSFSHLDVTSQKTTSSSLERRRLDGGC